MGRTESSDDGPHQPWTVSIGLGVPELLAVLLREGELTATAASRAGLNPAVPSCPGWTVGDVVGHLGGVYRWATTILVEERQVAMALEERAALREVWPAGDLLLPWFRDVCRSAVGALQSADPHLDCWTFLPADSPRAFWARRLAHETGVHRADVEAAVGAVSPFPVPVALDGIEEMLFGFAARKRSLPVDSPRELRLCPTDAEVGWRVSLAPDGVHVSRERGDGDCRVTGTASSLFLLLWNRPMPTEVEVSGDHLVIDLWRDWIRV